LTLAAVLLTVLLGGCGFRLEGDRPLPPALNSVYIDLVYPYHVATPALETALQERIIASGGTVKSDIAQATSVLRLSGFSVTQETLAVGPDGTAIEYRLVVSVNFELRSAGKILIAQQSQGVSRSYSFTATEILAKEAEEQRLENFMQSDLAQLILLRVEAELAHSNGAAVAS
jgi:LPS-assembly lipoprotein